MNGEIIGGLIVLGLIAFAVWRIKKKKSPTSGGLPGSGSGDGGGKKPTRKSS